MAPAARRTTPSTTRRRLGRSRSGRSTPRTPTASRRSPSSTSGGSSASSIARSAADRRTSRLPLRPATAPARVDELRGSRLHPGLLELLAVAEPACDAAGLGLLLGQHEGDCRSAAARAARAAGAVHVTLVL